MTKKQLLSMVAVSTLVLSNASAVFADGVSSSATLGDSSALVSPSDAGATVGQPTDGAGVEVSDSTLTAKPVDNQGSTSDTGATVEQPTTGADVGSSNSTSTAKPVDNQGSTSDTGATVEQPTTGTDVGSSNSTSIAKPVDNQGSTSDTGATVGQPTTGTDVGSLNGTSTAKPVDNQGSTSDTSLGQESKPSKDSTVGQPTDGAGVEVSGSTSPVKPVDKQDSTSTSLGKESKSSKDATVTDGAGVEVSGSTSPVKPVDKQGSSSSSLGKDSKPVSEKADKVKSSDKQSENIAPGVNPVENVGTNAGQVSQVTKQVIENVSYDAPVVLESGYQVVNTQDAVVTAVDTAGNTVKTSAENLGGKTNSDGTVSFKTSTGEMKTLPHTGEKTAWWSWIVGIIVILGAVYLGAKDKITELIDKLRGIEYEYIEEDEDDDE
ncbi:LPXTG cell wall anchor domain-containing protein [Streptococcus raffinosi]|uniref:LPXTG cell wall anchor domain-containing protein n=1 Tax=Streptococcus raffinosi TaxID=3053355 RepID=UPI002575025C|nr:LPXTG cell wall anchor domain-containing protein [Streptococcus sp. VTCC 12813]MDM0095597.1 LPXTG cell wall anchor domain-containing protein [Streptococcus sp. VTCC 12813]